MTDNPYDSPKSAGNSSESTPPDGITTGKAAYNVVSDTVTGVNLRGSDNKFQAKFVAVSVLLLTVIGAILALLNSSWKLPWYGGAMAGAFAGLVFGILASGIFLMIYRAVRHAQGKHD